MKTIRILVPGPPWTHPSLPNVAHYIGSTTPKSSPSNYLSAIQALIQAYREEFQAHVVDNTDLDDPRVADVIPLVVNTMGWTKGLGADLMSKIEDLIEPTHIVEVAAAQELGQPPSVHTQTRHRARIYVVESMSSSDKYSPADYRHLSTMSYFHAIFPIPSPGPRKQISAASWNTWPLCSQPPYEVDWAVALDKVTVTGTGSEDVVPAEILRVLNGAVVGLVECEPGTLDLEGTALQSELHIPYMQGSPCPAPSSSTCHGLALIRSVSSLSTHLHVLTPVPPYFFSKCRVLVKGELELPMWGMLDHRGNGGDVAGIQEGKVPFLQWDKGDGVGAERRRVRRNLMRRGQM